MRAKTRALRITCINHLEQIGLSCRVWEGDHTNLYPMQVSATNGGTKDFVTGANAFRHFQVMSNELSTPKILICPAESDRMRSSATNFEFMNNSNISYFIGLDANETNPQLILSGDRNITNGTRVKNGLLAVTTNSPAGWTSEMHNGVGNICLADGSGQQISIVRFLRDTITRHESRNKSPANACNLSIRTFDYKRVNDGMNWMLMKALLIQYSRVI